MQQNITRNTSRTYSTFIMEVNHVFKALRLFSLASATVCILAIALSGCGEDNEPLVDSSTSILDSGSSIVATNEDSPTWIATERIPTVSAQLDDETQVIALNGPHFLFSTLTKNNKTALSFSLMNEKESIPPTEYPLAATGDQSTTVYWSSEIVTSNAFHYVFHTEPPGTSPIPGRILAYSSSSMPLKSDGDLAIPTPTIATGIYSAAIYNNEKEELVVNAMGLGSLVSSPSPKIFWWRPASATRNEEIKPLIDNIGPYGAKVRSKNGDIYVATTEASGPRILRLNKEAVDDALDNNTPIDGIATGTPILTLKHPANQNVLLTDFDIVENQLFWIQTIYAVDENGFFTEKLSNSLHRIDLETNGNTNAASAETTEIFTTRDLDITQMLQVQGQQDGTVMVAIQLTENGASTITESFLLSNIQ